MKEITLERTIDGKEEKTFFEFSEDSGMVYITSGETGESVCVLIQELSDFLKKVRE